MLLLVANVGYAQVFNMGGNNSDRWGTTANNNQIQTIRRVGIGDFTAYGGPKAALHVNENLLTDLILNASNYYAPGHLFRTDGPSNQPNIWEMWTGTGSQASEKFSVFVPAGSNNSILQASAGDMRFNTGGNNTRITILGNNGFVGIGSGFVNPQNLLHLHENSTNDIFLQITNNSTGSELNNGLTLGLNGPTKTRVEMRQFSADDILFRIEQAGDNILRNILIMKPNGNTGVFTSNPLAKLHVNGVSEDGYSSTGNVFATSGPLGSENSWKMLTRSVSQLGLFFEVGKLWTNDHEINNQDFHIQASRGNLVFHSNTNNSTNFERMRIMGTYSTNAFTRVSISANPYSPIDGSLTGQNTFAASLLHIGCRVPANYGGFRDWMNITNNTNSGYGIYISSPSHNVYLGLKKELNPVETYSTNLCWGDDASSSSMVAGRFKFIYTTTSLLNLSASQQNGLETAVITSDGNLSKFGIGDFETFYTNPKRQLDVYDNGLDETNGRSQLRLSQQLDSEPNLGTYTDFQTTGLNNNYDGGGIGYSGHLLINPRDKDIMKTVAINMINNDTPLNNELSLDVNGQVNIRSINQNNNLNMILVADPNNHNRVMWRDASTLGNGGGNMDLDWEYIPTLGVFSGHPNSDGYNDKSVYVGLPSSYATLLERAVKFAAYGDQAGYGPTGLPGLIVGGFRNKITHQSGSGQSRAYGVFAECKASGLSVDNSMNVAVGGNSGDAYENYGGRFLIENPIGNMNCAVYGYCPSDGSGGHNYAGFFNGDLEYTGFFGQASDSNLKKNIEPLFNAFSIIEQLKPISFEYKTNLSNNINLPIGIQFGLIAQEVESVIPSIVSTNFVPQNYDENGILLSDSFSYKSIDYIRIIPFLIASTKELKHENDSLKQIIQNYDSRLNTIENMLSQCCSENKSTTVSVTVQTHPIIIPASDKTVLNQNQPNPFQTITTFSYVLGEEGNVRLIIDDSYGHHIVTLVSEYQRIGNYSVDWDASKQQAGLYFYSLMVNGKLLVKKAIKIE